MKSETFADRLMRLIKAKGFTVAEFTEKAAIYPKAPFRWKREGGYPDALEACRMAKLLGVSVEYLVTGNEALIPLEISEILERITGLAKNIEELSDLTPLQNQ